LGDCAGEYPGLRPTLLKAITETAPREVLSPGATGLEVVVRDGRRRFRVIGGDEDELGS
jgi:hypothetical protein